MPQALRLNAATSIFLQHQFPLGNPNSQKINGMHHSQCIIQGTCTALSAPTLPISVPPCLRVGCCSTRFPQNAVCTSVTHPTPISRYDASCFLIYSFAHRTYS